MKKLFSLEHSLELLAWLVTLGTLLAVAQTFVIGKHYVIPTMILMLAILIGNFARFATAGQRWAKHVLFWIFFLATCHLFFALFWAATPREILGGAFLPVYGALFVLFAFLCWHYARRNLLFGH